MKWRVPTDMFLVQDNRFSFISIHEQRRKKISVSRLGKCSITFQFRDETIKSKDRFKNIKRT
jgi:hypothetical protein